jgi:hypothetical protein
MASGLCHGHDTLIASKLHEAFTIICIRLPQDFVMDFELAVRCEAATGDGEGPSGPGPTSRLQNTLGMRWQRVTVVRAQGESRRKIVAGEAQRDEGK